MAGSNIAVNGIVLEQLTKDNYENWRCLVKHYLEGHDLWDVVLDPSRDGETDQNWKRKNAKALHIIKLSCGSENLTRIRNIEVAKEAWNKLAAAYSSELTADPDIEQGTYLN